MRNPNFEQRLDSKPATVVGPWAPAAIKCVDCGCDVFATSHNTTRCKPCQKAAIKRQQKRAAAKLTRKRAADRALNGNQPRSRRTKYS